MGGGCPGAGGVCSWSRSCTRRVEYLLRIGWTTAQTRSHYVVTIQADPEEHVGAPQAIKPRWPIVVSVHSGGPYRVAPESCSSSPRLEERPMATLDWVICTAGDTCRELVVGQMGCETVVRWHACVLRRCNTPPYYSTCFRKLCIVPHESLAYYVSRGNVCRFGTLERSGGRAESAHHHPLCQWYAHVVVNG